MSEAAVVVPASGASDCPGIAEAARAGIWDIVVEGTAPPRGVKTALMRVPGYSTRDLSGAVVTQTALRTVGAYVLNPLANKFLAAQKDCLYAALGAAGIRAPFAVSNPTRDQIQLAWDLGLLRPPFVVRSTDRSFGIGLDLAMTPDQGHEIAQALRMQSRWVMACSYHETTWKGYHSKWRAYVFDGEVDLWERGIDRGWVVNWRRSREFDVADFKAANEMKDWPRQWDFYATGAAAVAKADACSIDMLGNPDYGPPIIVDVNLAYGMGKPPELFPDDVAAFREGHFRRQAEWVRRCCVRDLAK